MTAPGTIAGVDVAELAAMIGEAALHSIVDNGAWREALAETLAVEQ